MIEDVRFCQTRNGSDVKKKGSWCAALHYHKLSGWWCGALLLGDQCTWPTDQQEVSDE